MNNQNQVGASTANGERREGGEPRIANPDGPEAAPATGEVPAGHHRTLSPLEELEVTFGSPLVSPTTTTTPTPVGSGTTTPEARRRWPQREEQDSIPPPRADNEWDGIDSPSAAQRIRESNREKLRTSQIDRRTKRAQEFLKLCRTPMDFNRAGQSSQRERAWDIVRETFKRLNTSEKSNQGLGKFAAKYRENGDKGPAALHFVCAGRPPIDLVDSLIDLSRTPLMWDDMEGNLPLHNAAKYGASLEVVEAVLQAGMGAIDETNNDGHLPLLDAVMSNAPPKVVKLLRDHSIVNNKDEVSKIDEFCKVSKKFFHLCSRVPDADDHTDKSWDDIRDELNRIQTEAQNMRLARCVVEKIDDDEDTPVHILCSHCPPLDIVESLIEVTDKPLRMKNDWGGLPLHCAVLRGADDEASRVAQFLCTKYPDATKIRDDYGSYPLHYALHTKASASVVSLLIKEFPDACRVKNKNGSLPLHIAIKKGAAVSVVNALVTAYPGAKHVSNKDGFRPLHMAIKNYSSRQVIEILEGAGDGQEEHARKAKEFLDLCDVDRRTQRPSIGLGRDVSVGVEQRRQAMWEEVRRAIGSLKGESKILADEAASYCDDEGNTPLHIVCKNRPPIDIVTELVEMTMTPICQMKNKKELLPLHIALRGGASFEIVKALYDASPETRKVPNDEGKLPFQMAMELNAPTEVKRLLFDPDQARGDEMEGLSLKAREFRRLCTASRHENKQSGRTDDLTHTWSSIRLAILELRKEPGVAKQVAETVDDDSGMTPLHIVCASPNPPVDVVKSIIGLSREPLRYRDRRDQLPVHVALKKRVSNDVLKLLIRAHPQDTKRADFEPGGLDWIREALSFDTSVEVIQLLTDASPVPCTEIGLIFLESLEAHHRIDSVRAFKRENRPEELGWGEPVKVSKPKMRVLLNSFLDECASQKSHDEKVVDRLFELTRNWSLRLKKDAIAHPQFHVMLNEKISQRFFTCILMLDLFIHAIIIVAFHHATSATILRDSADQEYNYAIDAGAWETSLLSVGIFYLGFREIVQALSYHADRLWLWYKDVWNWLDVAYIILLISSTVMMRSESRDSGAVQTLVMVTGGLAWIYLLLQLKSTYLSFSVFVSGVLHVILKVIPFIITSLIVLEAFAFMYFIDARHTEECRDGSFRESSSPTFCTFRDSQLKVYTMVVAIEADDFTDYNSKGQTWLSVFFAFLFIVILLNVLIAIVNENWEDVRRKGEKVFWRHRYDFVNEVDGLRGWLRNCYEWTKNASKGNFGALPGSDYIQMCGGCYGILCRAGRGLVRICVLVLKGLWVLAGAVTLGLLWSDDVRMKLWCKSSEEIDDGMTHQTLREEMEERFQEMGDKVDSVQQDLASQKKQLDDIQQMLFTLSQNLAQQGGARNEPSAFSGNPTQQQGGLRKEPKKKLPPDLIASLR